MKRAKQEQQRTTIQSWKQAKAVLDRWRKNLVNLQVELKHPRVIGVAPIDFMSREPAEREGIRRKKFRRQLIYSKDADLTIRRLSDAILVVEDLRPQALLRD